MTPEIQAKEKTVVSAEGEQTKTGPIFVPAVDIYESQEGMTLVADMPGVDKDGLAIDLDSNTLTIRGTIKSIGEETKNVLHREYDEGDYFRQFTVSDVIDQERISANLKDGVLTLFLPKVKPAQPRRIEVTGE